MRSQGEPPLSDHRGEESRCGARRTVGGARRCDGGGPPVFFPGLKVGLLMFFLCDDDFIETACSAVMGMRGMCCSGGVCFAGCPRPKKQAALASHSWYEGHIYHIIASVSAIRSSFWTECGFWSVHGRHTAGGHAAQRSLLGSCAGSSHDSAEIGVTASRRRLIFRCHSMPDCASPHEHPYRTWEVEKCSCSAVVASICVISTESVAGGATPATASASP